MSMETKESILSALADFQDNDAVFSRYTNPQLWNDPWISKRMLEAHLDPEGEAASRKPPFIDESAAFIVKRFGLGPGGSVVDFGCGPGLYAIRLARAGARITGIDLSENSLSYARRTAEREGLAIRYLQGDYLDLRLPGKADLAIMIYCDFGVLGPEKRRRLLSNVRGSLKPGGLFFFDVASLSCLDAMVESRSWTSETGGFFGPDAYLHLYELKKYPEARAFVEKHLVVGEEGIRSYFCWNACYSAESLAAALEEEGFTVENVYADVRGRPADPASPTLAVAARVP
jgi:SAM-dependent methyltransferase